MTYVQALILGIVEGLTEFLPISSTGHLYLSRQLMGIADTDFTKAFDIIIQVGAMLAVIWHCRLDFLSMTRSRAINLFIAFLPAAVLGFLAGSSIKRHLFAPLPIVAALVVGGIAMWVIEEYRKKKTSPEKINVENLSTADCFKIGLFQCLALWPGTSRAMSTILGGRFLGLSPQSAAKFSFLLAVPTLLAASGYDALKHRDVLFSSGNNVMLLVTGILVSFAVAHLVIQGFVAYLGKHDLKSFAYYRVVAGILFWYFLSR